MASMLDQLRELVSPEMLSTLTAETGESESAVSNGLTAAIPTIAAAIANRADDRSFMSDLAGLATKTSIATDPASASAAVGARLPALLGSNLSAVTAGIARGAGIRESSSASLIGAAATLVLGYLGRFRRDNDLTVSDLADRLRDERAAFSAALPDGIELPLVSRPRPSRTLVTAAVASAAVLAAIGGARWWAAHDIPAAHARVEVSEEFKPVGTSGSFHAPPVGSRGSFFEPFTRRLPRNATITFPTGSAEDRVSAYLASAVGGATLVTCERIGFDGQSATLTPESREQLNNIVTILWAYPRAKVTVSGHTNIMDDEEANQSLSTARAKAVADSLIAAGVDAERIRAEGYGSRMPLADEGRARTSRVMLDVSVR